MPVKDDENTRRDSRPVDLVLLPGGSPLDNDQFAIFFGDVRANVYAVNAMTGALIWKSKIDDHPAARVTGAPTIYSGVVYVGVYRSRRSRGLAPPINAARFAAASSR